MRVIRSIVMMAVSGFCLFVAVSPPIDAARKRPVAEETDREADVDRRVTALEQLNSEHRMTVLETKVDQIQLVSRGSIGGVGVLLIEAVMRLGKKKREDEA